MAAVLRGNNSSIDEDNLPPGYSPLKVPLYLQIIIITMYSIVIILAIGGNSIVCYIVFRARRMRTVMNFFIVSLAFSDILMAVLCIPFTFVANLVLNYWPFGDILCPIVTYFQTGTVFVSSLTLVAISMDRYVGIIYPLRQKMSQSQAILIICIVWLVAFLIPLPTAITSRTHRYVNYTEAPEFCEERWEYKTAYGIFILILQYFVPLVVLIFTYGRIMIVVWINKTPGEAMSERDQRLSESKRKIIKMMVAVVVIYAICWLPLHAVNLAGDANPLIYNIKYMNIVWMTAHWLAMSNCMYNPFVYCWMNAKFRNGFLRVLKCFMCGLIKVEDQIEMRRMRRMDTTTTSVVNNSYKRSCSTKLYDGCSECTYVDRH